MRKGVDFLHDSCIETVKKTVQKTTTHRRVCAWPWQALEGRHHGPVSGIPAQPAPTGAQAPLSILRTETVLSRFPIHNLDQARARHHPHPPDQCPGGAGPALGRLLQRAYGPPRHLAYKLDTHGHQSAPRYRCRARSPACSKSAVCARLRPGWTCECSGRQQAHLKHAFHQNASAYIVAYLRYRGRDGIERTLNTGFTRYSVIFTGERLPDGTTADAVYLVLSEPYRDILNSCPGAAPRLCVPEGPHPHGPALL